MKTKFDFRVMLFRVITAGYTAFFASSANAYAVKADISLAMHVGIAAGVAGVIAGFGIDQLVYHFIKETKS